jgi:cobalt/nickel transport protein
MKVYLEPEGDRPNGLFFWPAQEVKMKRPVGSILQALALLFLAGVPAGAHFGMIIPSDEMVMKGDSKEVTLQLMFWHPFEGTGMDLVTPAEFGVVARGRKKDLLATLTPQKLKGRDTWKTSYTIKRPGIYVFYLIPQPYWEPAEDCYIVHYTKTVIAAYGGDEGWDQAIGLKTEIVPLSKPFGLYAGNVFQGVVLLNGKPVPGAEVEVEYFNKEGKYSAPTDYMITQTIKADPNGIFTYSAPRPGWWGFAALSTDDRQIKGKEVEIGAVLWVNFHEMK